MGASYNDEDQEGDNEAEHKAGTEAEKHDIEQLLVRQRPKLPALRTFLAVLNTVCAFIAALAAVGVLAFYAGHQTIREVMLFVSIALLLVVIFIALWLYVRTLTLKRPARDGAASKRNLLERFALSRIAPAMKRFMDNRVIRLINFGIAIDQIAYALIRVFPRNPNLAVALTAFFTLALSVYVTNEIVRPIQRGIAALWEQNDRIIAAIRSVHTATFDTIGATQTAVFDLFRKTHEATAETNAATIEAITATNDLARAAAGVPALDNEADASPGEPSNNTASDDE